LPISIEIGKFKKCHYFPLVEQCMGDLKIVLFFMIPHFVFLPISFENW